MRNLPEWKGLRNKREKNGVSVCLCVFEFLLSTHTTAREYPKRKCFGFFPPFADCRRNILKKPEKQFCWRGEKKLYLAKESEREREKKEEQGKFLFYPFLRYKEENQKLRSFWVVKTSDKIFERKERKIILWEVLLTLERKLS